MSKLCPNISEPQGECCGEVSQASFDITAWAQALLAFGRGKQRNWLICQDITAYRHIHFELDQ